MPCFTRLACLSLAALVTSPALADPVETSFDEPIAEIGGLTVADLLPPSLIRPDANQRAYVGEDEGAFVINLDSFFSGTEDMPITTFSTSIAKLDEVNQRLEGTGDRFEVDGQPCIANAGQIAGTVHCRVGDMTLDVLASAPMFDKPAIKAATSEARALVETFALGRLADARSGSTAEPAPDPTLGMAMTVPGLGGLKLAELLPEGAMDGGVRFSRNENGFLISGIYHAWTPPGAGELYLRLEVFDWYDAAKTIAQAHADADADGKAQAGERALRIFSVGDMPCTAEPGSSWYLVNCAVGDIVVGLNIPNHRDTPSVEAASGIVPVVEAYLAGVSRERILAAQDR